MADGPSDRRCAGQVRYLSWSDTEKAMRHIKRFKPRDNHKGRVKPYRCRHCQGWHLGHIQDS